MDVLPLVLQHVCVCEWEAVSFIGLGSVQSPGDYITPGPSGNVCACVCADARARRERWRARLLRLSKRDFVFVRPVISAYRNQFSPSCNETVRTQRWSNNGGIKAHVL